MHRIWAKLALVIITVSLGGIVLTTILSLKEMNYHFTFFKNEMDEKQAKDLLSLIKEKIHSEQEWKSNSRELLSNAAKLLDVNIQVFDINKQFVQEVKDDGITYTTEINRQNLIPISTNNHIIGYIRLMPIGDQTQMSLEQHFQYAHQRALLWTMLVLILLATVVSVFVARKLVKPVIGMRKVSIAATNGDYSREVNVPPGKDELKELVISFNQLVKKLRKQDELRKRLTSDIAHELRTPINTLLAQIEGMIDGVWDKTVDHLESVRGEILRLSKLINDLDQVIQTEAGAQKLNLEIMDVSLVAWEVAEAMLPSFQKKNVTLQRSFESSVMIKADEQRLSQVIVNVLSNALKHTADKGLVSITIQQNKQYAVIQVRDNGTGIAKNDLPFVFDRFYRGDRSRQRETGGSGLGLTIAKGIVESHQGEIFIESEEGVGTEVRIHIPRMNVEKRR